MHLILSVQQASLSSESSPQEISNIKITDCVKFTEFIIVSHPMWDTLLAPFWHEMLQDINKYNMQNAKEAKSFWF